MEMRNKITNVLQKLNPMGKSVETLSARIAETEARLNRAYEAGYYDGANMEDEPASGDIARYGYRRATATGPRDLSQLTHDQIINTVWMLYQSNGVAKRGLTLKRDHILGRNTRPTTPGDTELQEILDKFWKSNKLDRRIKKFLISHSLFGELCLPVFVRETDGRVKLGYIDPADIDEVLCHPHNALEQWIVICKDHGQGKRAYRIIRHDDGHVIARNDGSRRVVPPDQPDKLLAASQAVLEPWEMSYLSGLGLIEYTGSCFYFDKNNVSNQPRGFSDLLQSADMLDQHDETLFSLGEREGLAGYFSWDVSIKGGKEEVEARAARLRKSPPVKKGQINAHNESEIWQMQTADLKQPGTIATAKALKTQALEGLNQPPHWHGDPDNTNRASAESSDNPANKSLEHEQDDVRNMIIEMCEFVRDQAAIAGVWQPASITNEQNEIIGETGNISVSMPEIAKKDMGKVGVLLTQVVQAATIAHLDLKVISQETVAVAIAKVFGELGVDYDPVKELEKINEAAMSGNLATAEAANQWLTDNYLEE